MANPADRNAFRRPGRVPPDVHADEEIEILEVVGLEEDAPPRPAAEEPAEDGDEIVLDFEDDPAPPADRTVAPAPPVATVALERFVRLQADFENFRKRTDRERMEEGRYAAGQLVANLLPVLDNLERALASPPPAGEADRALREGLALVHRQFLEELRRAGLRPVPAVGERFDPMIHDAVETVEAGDAPGDTVVDELMRGYWFHDRLLRPAMVRVAVGAHESGSSDAGGEET
jgi:molecular chaperone GrpE